MKRGRTAVRRQQRWVTTMLRRVGPGIKCDIACSGRSYRVVYTPEFVKSLLLCSKLDPLCPPVLRRVSCDVLLRAIARAIRRPWRGIVALAAKRDRFQALICARRAGLMMLADIRRGPEKRVGVYMRDAILTSARVGRNAECVRTVSGQDVRIVFSPCTRLPLLLERQICAHVREIVDLIDPDTRGPTGTTASTASLIARSSATGSSSIAAATSSRRTA